MTNRRANRIMLPEDSEVVMPPIGSLKNVEIVDSAQVCPKCNFSEEFISYDLPLLKFMCSKCNYKTMLQRVGDPK
jgi:hypothetical protein